MEAKRQSKLDKRDQLGNGPGHTGGKQAGGGKDKNKGSGDKKGGGDSGDSSPVEGNKEDA
jgi:hypothetical protein